MTDCKGKPLYSLGHKWGERKVLSTGHEDGFAFQNYERTCQRCGAVQTGKLYLDLLADIFSLPKDR